MTLRCLDLFCGAGGASMGLHRAGFEVAGVDNRPQPHYPFRFVQADALTFPLDGYDLIWASPPCQAYTSMLYHGLSTHKHLSLVGHVRGMLEYTARHHGTPYIIENVVGAPLHNWVELCGTMFGLGVKRHRRFESNVLLMVPYHKCAGGKGARKRGDGGTFYRVYGHEVGTVQEWRGAMGIDWMTKPELAQSIPPAYSEFLAKQVIEQLQRKVS